MEGGFDLKTVEKDSNIQCSICLHLLRDAMGTPCSHLFCRVCIQKLIGRDGYKKESFKCPECRETVSEDKIYACPFADRLVKGANVYCSCKDEGCQWVGTLTSFFEQHKIECTFQTVPCHHEGCNYSGMKRKIKDHESNCKHRMVECKHCQAQVKENALDLKDHLNEVCPFAIVECIYSKFGCREKVLRKDLDEHTKESTNRHMAFMCEQLSQTQSASDREISKLKEENKKLKAKVKMLARFCPDLQIKDYLLKGVDKFIKKTSNSGLVEDYATWYENVTFIMLQNKLYRTDDAMFIKLRYLGRKNIYWYSVYMKMNFSDDGSESVLGSNGFSLSIRDRNLVLRTETRFKFGGKNSRAFVLHPTDCDNAEQGMAFEGVSFNHWQFPLLPNKVHGTRGVIICLIKM